MRRSGGQALAALGAPRREHLAAADRGHAGAKAVLPRTADLGGLERAFHGVPSCSKMHWKSLTLERVNGRSVKTTDGEQRNPGGDASDHYQAGPGRSVAHRRPCPWAVGPVDNWNGHDYNPQPTVMHCEALPGPVDTAVVHDLPATKSRQGRSHRCHLPPTPTPGMRA